MTVTIVRLQKTFSSFLFYTAALWDVSLLFLIQNSVQQDLKEKNKVNKVEYTFIWQEYIK